VTPRHINTATGDHHCIPRDSVDRLLADWHAVRPALDFSPVGVIARLGRVRSQIDVELERVFAEYGLTRASFGVLVTLARLGQPAGVSQRTLMNELGLTSGTVSVRMDRLVELGLVRRDPDPDDKRNTRITLTDEGRSLFERAVPAHLENERRLLSSLSAAEQELLATLLRKLLVEFEGSLPPPDAPLRLGMSVAPSHVTIEMRRAVGLPAQPGLLVRTVADDGPAAAAGVAAGDVLMRAGHRELRSIAALYAAISDAAAARRMRLVTLRGIGERTVTLRLGAVPAAEPLPLASTAGRSARDEHTV
jgi:DNA-binding MarR family transcriptional regulator